MTDRLLPYRVMLAASVVYFAVGGLFASWFPNDGLDLYVSYVVGTASLQGADGYSRTAYRETWDSLPKPPALASTRAFAFAYPPAWMPIAAGLALLPWGVALAVWKVVNVLALIGIVGMTGRLLALDARDRLVVWSFALVLSPTISVIVLGQSSLVILFCVLAAARAAQRDRPLVAGMWLGLAMMKPQLALPLAIFLALRGELRTIAVAGACVVALSGLGLLVAHSDLASYLGAVRGYAASNRPDSHIGVGVGSLLGHFGGVDADAATGIGLVVGVAVVTFTALARRSDGRRHALGEVVAAVIYAAPLGFHCHGYDMVALVPLFAWARARVRPPGLAAAMQAVCLPAIVPRAAVRLAWGTLTVGVTSATTTRLVEQSFRSWIVVLLLPLVVAALRSLPEESRESGHASSA